MEVIIKIVEKMLEPIIEASCTSIERQFGYLIHCKKSINEFADEVNKLSLVKERIQTRVDTALQNAEDIHKEVLEWQRNVQSIENDNSRLLQEKENLKCVDVCSRYRLGKEGKNKRTVVTGLIEEGNNFDTVGHLPPLTGIWHRTYSIKYENFHSRELVFNQIMEAIKDDTKYKIGIHGIPGAGKTRMMKEVAQQAEKEKLFDEIVEIVVTQNPNLKDLQQKLAEGLNMDLNRQTEDARKGLLRERMLKNGKKILVMVDDIWDDEIKLEDIGIPATNDRTMGCKILLTSRRRDVCEAMGVEKEFPIGLLSESEAWSLFKKKVGDSIECRERRPVAEAVCRECAGLPLAILAIGGALLNKSKQVWEDALQQLGNSSGEKIAGLPKEVKKLYSRIELSYNHLETNDAKSIFLLCPLFGEDAEISINDLVSYGVGLRLFGGGYTMKTTRNRAGAMVDTLKVSSLLLEGRNKNFVKMHDVIRDVAISIASKKEDARFLVKAGVEKWPEEDEYKECRAISLRFNKDCVLPDDLECPELRTLMLEGRYYSPEVPRSFFDGMEKLEVLCLSNIRISTLPSSLKNLRMLRLYNCQLVNIASLQELRKLEILIIKDDYLQELAPEIGQLDGLLLLDVRRCRLKILPSGVISSLSQLEELYIAAFSLEEVHVPNVMFKSLIRFRISIGSKVYRFSPEDIPSTVTRILNLGSIPYKKELNILMAKAEVVSLNQVKGLKNAFDDGYGEGFQDLELLQVYDCNDMEHLFGKPKSISHTRGPNCVSGSFSKLSVLQIDSCQQLRYLFSTAIARGLAKLQELKVDYCKILEEIIRDDQQVMELIIFHGLKKMDLRRLPKLRSFYFNMKNTSTSTLMQALFNDKVAFPALEELRINGLKRPTAICDDQLQSKEAEDSFGSLRYMEVSACSKLMNVFWPSTARRLVHLETFDVSDCEGMIEIVALEMGPSIQYGEVEEEEEEEDLVQIIVFPQLKHIKFQNLPNLTRFFYYTGGSKNSLFNYKVAFPALEELRINGLKMPTTICDDQLQSKEAKDSFRRLRYMQVSACSKLMNVFWPSTARRLVHLETLNVSYCKRMIEIVALEMGPSIQYGEVEEEEEILEEIIRGDQLVMEPIIFHGLKKMRLEGLPKLRSFYFNMNNTSTFTLTQALFNDKVAFPALEELRINGLERPTTICDDQLQSKEAEDSFRRLRYLQVSACSKLMNVFWSSTARRLVHLETFDVSHCEGMIEIVALEMGSSIKYGEVEEEEEEEDLVQIIVFPQLKSINFRNLPSLRRFFNYTGGSKKSLFNHKVKFPALEKLNIYGLVMLGAIWDDDLSQGSEVQDFFPQLSLVTCECFDKLKNGIPPNALPWLQKLEIRNFWSL